MEFHLKERPVFRVKHENNVKNSKKLIKFLQGFGYNSGKKELFDFSDKKSIVFYADNGKKILGILHLVEFTKEVLWCNIFLVKKEFRRQGLGTSLFKEAIGYLYKNKIKNVLAISEFSDKGSRKFLKKLGFKKIGKIKHFLSGKDYNLWEYLL